MHFNLIILTNGYAINVREWRALRRQDMEICKSMASTPFHLSTPISSAQITAKQCSHDRVKAGKKADTIPFIASAVPLMMGAQAIQWARANLNYTAQAHIISLVSRAPYFIVAELASHEQPSF